MLKKIVNKKELYVINHRYFYLFPICAAKEDLNNIKILLNSDLQFIIIKYRTNEFIFYLILIIIIIIILVLLTFAFTLTIKLDQCYMFLYIILVYIILYGLIYFWHFILHFVFNVFPDIIKSIFFRTELLSINKQSGTISLLLYEDFPTRKTYLINLPIKVVSKIAIVKELKLKEVFKLDEFPTHSLCLPPDSEYDYSANEIYTYYYFKDIIIIYFGKDKKEILENIKGLEFKKLKTGVEGGFDAKLYYGLIYNNDDEIFTFLPLPHNFNEFKNKLEQYFNQIEYKDKIEIRYNYE